MQENIQAITFDLWDTIFIDDSDEAERQERGLDPKPEARVKLVQQALVKSGFQNPEQVPVAFEKVNRAFAKSWADDHRTWTVKVRVDKILEELGFRLPLQTQANLVRSLEEMELEVQPQLAPKIGQALQLLKIRYKLGVISDAVFSPGRALRKLLDYRGLLDLFRAQVYSDEVGCSKPNPRVFHLAAQQLGVLPEQIVHVGDRESNDILGPQAVGAKAILSVVVLDRGSKQTQANAVCRDYRDLPALVENLKKSG